MQEQIPTGRSIYGYLSSSIHREVFERELIRYIADGLALFCLALFLIIVIFARKLSIYVDRTTPKILLETEGESQL